MKWKFCIHFGSLLLACGVIKSSAVDRYVAPDGGHVSPFTTWADAATNIQSAIDAASGGDTVWVTNGIYTTGGKVMAGDLTNRVALDKPLSVISINGAAATEIQGQKDIASTNGPAAVRCAWLTNGAVLRGFTLRGGATRSAGDQFQLRSGGGAWASGTNALIWDCILVDNAASFGGGGAYRGWLSNCIVRANVSQGDGGGVYSNIVYNSRLLENSARSSGGGSLASTVVNSALTGNTAASGGGASSGVLRNCTVTLNKANSGGGLFGTPPNNGVTNCIIWSNTATTGANYTGVVSFRNSCTTPLPSGVGNTSSDPLLVADGIHVSSNSPCLAAGLAIATGADLDGQSWSSPPAMGCDEWNPEPVVSLPGMVFESWGRARISALGIGQPPFTYRWLLNGTLIEDGAQFSGAYSPSLLIQPLQPEDAGNYQLVVSNALGTATSQVAQLNIRCVDVNSSAPTPPYASWATAASTIQEAVDASAFGDLVLVTNGIYAQGGKVMAGDLINRVALDKPLTVMSASGSTATLIQGDFDLSTTNGPGAARCTWLMDGAALIGFTLRCGATRGAVGDSINLQSGGGVWCNSTSASVANCIIQGCSAGAGGGAGAYRGTLINCLIKGNAAYSPGVGTSFSSLVNCTVTANRPLSSLGGACGFATTNIIYNSIIWGNQNPGSVTAEYSGGTISYSCTRPLPPGAGNISVDPQFEPDGVHLLTSSPCLNTGSPSPATGMDIDNQPWTNPPSMGCDERLLTLAVGQPQWAVEKGVVRFDAAPVGEPPITAWWYRNGILVTNDSHHAGADTTQLSVSAFDPADAGLYHVVTSNAFGSTTSTWAQVRASFVNASNATPTAPFSNWATAATSIQDAIEAASHGDLIVVTNGLYATGGKAVAGDLTNRVVLDKALTVMALNGPEVTIVQGTWDGTSTNGPGAERCAWLGNWSTLCGFTLRHGATRAAGDMNTVRSGGGAWGLSPNALVRDCVISNSVAHYSGGGAVGSTLVKCTLENNRAANGAGVYRASLANCILRANFASGDGGGASASELKNCLLLGNVATFGGGALGSQLYNCTVVENEGAGVTIGCYIQNSIIWGNEPGNYATLSLSINHSCTSPAPQFSFGTNNIFLDPQLVDGFHLAATSPCRAAGSSLYISDTDLDGDAWLNPPSMGADQFTTSGLTGPLEVNIESPQTGVLVNRPLSLIGRVSGRASRIEWSFGDGPTATNLSYITSHVWTNTGDYSVTFTAFNDDNPLGVATNLMINVRPIPAPTWTSIQKLFNWFEIYFSTEAGVSNTIEFATNLAAPVNWMTLNTVVSTNSMMFIRDMTATNEARFYRIRAQ